MKIELEGAKNLENKEIDLQKNNIRFLMLVGATGSGKSYLIQEIIDQLQKDYNPIQLRITMLDMKGCDCPGVKEDFMLFPCAFDAKTAFEYFEQIIEDKRDEIIWIDINENDLVYQDRYKLENYFNKLLAMPNVYISYTTSKIDKEYFDDWFASYNVLKIIFKTYTKEDSEYLLGNDLAYNLKQGEYIVSAKNL